MRWKGMSFGWIFFFFVDLDVFVYCEGLFKREEAGDRFGGCLQRQGEVVGRLANLQGMNLPPSLDEKQGVSLVISDGSPFFNWTRSYADFLTLIDVRKAEGSSSIFARCRSLT
jgi:hypothetical protein